MMDWVPAVEPFAQTTTTVYVPGLTLDQTPDWLMFDPVSIARRPWVKFAWPLESSEALPRLPLNGVHVVVATETLLPLVLTEIPEFQAAAAGEARVRGSAAAATARPERLNS
uniref:Uncharacterized protein n=2 Tax=Streptomyces avermitilis TaxID=33903 RepID=A0A499VRA8_STRAX|nr:hypothetical protein SAVMC3_15660 [Streptomyces avermitilis]